MWCVFKVPNPAAFLEPEQADRSIERLSSRGASRRGIPRMLLTEMQIQVFPRQAKRVRAKKPDGAWETKIASGSFAALWTTVRRGAIEIALPEIMLVQENNVM